MKNVLFNDICYPTDAAGLTLMRFGEDVKSLTVKGDPSGVPSSLPWILSSSYVVISTFHMLSPQCLEDLLSGPQVLHMEVRLGV